MEKINDRENRSSCQITTPQLKQSLVVLTCFQAIRTLWQVWDSFDSRWPVTIQNTIQPITYISCSLVVLLMLISTSSTYSVYKGQHRSVTIGWWAYYIVTTFYIIVSFLFVSLLYMNKRHFITGCSMDRGADNEEAVRVGGACSHIWQAMVIWAVLDIMVNLVVNTMFIYILYRCRVDQYCFIQFTREQSTTFKLSHSTTTTLNDINNDDEFHVIDLNK